MRSVLATIPLFAIILLPGCGPSNSPRLESIRPHLKVGANRDDLVKQIGLQFHVASGQEIVETGEVPLLYDLDGSKKGRRLKLVFADKKLASAAVVKPGVDGKYTEVEEVLLPEPGS
jgi:hypothetical protein